MKRETAEQRATRYAKVLEVGVSDRHDRALCIRYLRRAEREAAVNAFLAEQRFCSICQGVPDGPTCPGCGSGSANPTTDAEMGAALRGLTAERLAEAALPHVYKGESKSYKPEAAIEAAARWLDAVRGLCEGVRP